MTETIKANIGERVTFRGLFRRHSVVEIPIIQRDYAQGRPSEVEVRTEFLTALFAALQKPEDDPSLPLDLDFVYGGVENGQRRAFNPLDGQQRLTTLFLLHWFLACKDRKEEDFAGFIRDGRKSLFCYAVRPSTGEFFDALVCWYPELTDAHTAQLSEIIQDQPWFFRSWRLDPTIQSALHMLDAIRERFKGAEGFYDKLASMEQPRVTFQLLDLNSFGLSDDLYIKMNARGKPLTAFETLKARLEQHIESLFPEAVYPLHGKPVKLREYFSHRIDTAWSDLFWRHRDRRTHSFDDKLMQLIRAIAVVSRQPDAADFENVVQTLRSYGPMSFFRMQELGCLDRALVEMLTASLDAWSEDPSGLKTYLPAFARYDERGIFERVIRDSRLTYEDLVQFYAYCSYLTKHRKNINADDFGNWMRVVRNLSVNTVYDRLEDFRRSILSVGELMPQAERILEHIALDSARLSGFSPQQWREERLKARLILRSEKWRAMILAAEGHGYFKGQVEFLLSFSGVLAQSAEGTPLEWSPEAEERLQVAFEVYLEKAVGVFSDSGLREFKNYRWERALLAIGDYLLRTQSNHSFLIDQDRDASWKRLLRGGLQPGDATDTKRLYVKALFDRIDLKVGVDACLDLVIEQADSMPDWRRVLVTDQSMMAFCGNRMIRWQSADSVYLLRKVRRSGDHAELFTYHLRQGLLQRKFEAGELHPFTALSYRVVNTDRDEPSVLMTCQYDALELVLTISNKQQFFEIRVFVRGSDLPGELASALGASLQYKLYDDGTVRNAVNRNDIEKAIDDVVFTVGEHMDD